MTKPYDEPDINGNDIIIRRINPVYHTVYDENIGANRISTVAYSPSSGVDGGMSIDVEKLIEGAGLNAVEYVTNPTYTCSVYFTAQDIRALGLRVGYEPLPDNFAHGEVWGSNGVNGFTRAQKKNLARGARWYHRVDGIELG